MRTWSGSPVPSTDRYGMMLVARAFLAAKVTTDRCMLSCYLTHQQADRQLWLDDFVAFFPELRN